MPHSVRPAIETVDRLTKLIKTSPSSFIRALTSSTAPLASQNNNNQIVWTTKGDSDSTKTLLKGLSFNQFKSCFVQED